MSERLGENWQIVAYNPETLKIRMTNADKLGFEGALKLVPSFQGGTESDLASFEAKCEFIFKNIPDSLKPSILEAIISQLKGNAFEAIRYKEISTWDELKKLFRTVFGSAHSVSYLQVQLSQMRQSTKETVKEFSIRIEKTAHELTHALTVDKPKVEAGIIAQTVQAHALSVFVAGISQSIGIILKARNIKIFEEAVLHAMEEEKTSDYFSKMHGINTPDKNKSNLKSTKDKSNIKCHRCDKFGHYANECRTSEHKIPTFRNPNSGQSTSREIKKEYSSKFCKYCKKTNHDISECFKLKNKKAENNKDRSVEEIQAGSSNVRIITPIEQEHITCFSDKFVKNEIKFLIDSGSEMNIIKISSLKGHIIVNERDKKNIKGIHASPVETIGSVVIPIFINKQPFVVKFDIVNNDFPIPEAGIIGINFLKLNKVMLDWDKEVLIIPEKTKTSPLILPPRSNCVLKIKADEKINHNIITVKKFEITEDVIVANSISPVKGDTVISNIINISEQPYVIDQLTTSNLKWEPYNDNIFIANEYTNTPNKIQKIRETVKTEHLNKEERDSILELCSRFSDLFFFEGDQLSATDIVTHKINTPRCVKPINIRPYRLPHAYQEEIEKQVREMKEANIIRDSVSPFNFPLVVVKKKKDSEGKQKIRICVDFRKLNEVTENEAYGLPNILEILESLGSSKYFSTLDLASGYHQIMIDKGDTHKTAFSTKSGHYEFLRLPFGLSSAPATFTRAMKSILMGLEELCTAYLDDIVVHGSSLKDHQNKLEQVFSRLRLHKLKLQPNKCAFLRKEVLYLGHVISEHGVTPDPNKLTCIKEYPRPLTEKDIKSFLGLLNYYRRFVDNFAKIAKPLTNLLKKNTPFVWSDMCEDAFQELKNKLMNPPLLIYPNWEDGKFNLMTDASQYAIGAILSQGEVPKDQPVAYASRTLNKAEENYSVIQKELLAIVWAVKYFRPYLYGKKFKIITDHRPLTYLFNIKDFSSQLMRWRLQLEEYDYEIVYRAGPQHSNADCLSRIRVVTSDEQNSGFEEFKQAENRPIFNSKIIEIEGSIKNAEQDENIILPIPNDNIITHPAIREIMNKFNLTTQLTFNDDNKFIINNQLNKLIIFYKLKNNHYDELGAESYYSAINEIKSFCIDKQITQFSIIRLEGLTTLTCYERTRTMFRYLFKNTNIKVTIYKEQYFSKEEKLQIIKEYHDTLVGGHQGVSRTIKRLKLKYQWKNMKQDVGDYIKNCAVCQKGKSGKNIKQPMLITSTVTSTFQKICLDIVGPLPKTDEGNTYILTIQDELSRYAVAVALATTDASTVARAFVECFICIYGIPITILTDCGTNFLSNLFKDVCKLLKIEKTNTTPWHPQSNGYLERSHKTLKAYLRSFVDKDTNWDTLINYAMFCYNTTVHTSTKFTPYELVFGKKPIIPSSFLQTPEPQYNYDDYAFDLKRIMQETHKTARENLIEKKNQNKQYYDQTSNPLELHVGDKVLMKEQNKKNTLYLNWTGPYEILLIHDNETITIKRGRRDYRIHINNVKKFFETDL